MTSYAAVAARAQSLVARKGAPVTFSHVTPGVYDPSTDTTTGATVTTVAGCMVQCANDPNVLKSLSLVASDTRTGYFTPSTFGELPYLNDTVTWGGIVYSVKSFDPTSPDGTAIGAYVIISR